MCRSFSVWSDSFLPLPAPLTQAAPTSQGSTWATPTSSPSVTSRASSPFTILEFCATVVQFAKRVMGGHKAALVPSTVVSHGCSDAMAIKDKLIKMTPEEIILENEKPVGQCPVITCSVPLLVVTTKMLAQLDARSSSIRMAVWTSSSSERTLSLPPQRRMSYIGLDWDNEDTYDLRDGNFITVGAKCFWCAEASSQPGSLAADYHELRRSHPQESVRQCRAIKRHDLFQRTVVRMTNRPTVLAPSTMSSRWLLQFSMDWRTCLVYEFSDRNIITVALNFSVAWKCYSKQVSLASGFHDTSLQSNMEWDYISDVGYVCILNDWISTISNLRATGEAKLADLPLRRQENAQVTPANFAAQHQRCKLPAKKTSSSFRKISEAVSLGLDVSPWPHLSQPKYQSLQWLAPIEHGINLPIPPGSAHNDLKRAPMNLQDCQISMPRPKGTADTEIGRRALRYRATAFLNDKPFTSP